MAAKKRIDWERIEPDWRAGIKSVLQIAADYTKVTGQKVSHTAINKHFKELGIPRDLGDKVRSKAEAIVNSAIVSGLVSAETTVSDARIVNDNAVLLATVQLSQRSDVQRGRRMVMALLGELEQTTDNKELFEKLGELMFNPDKAGNDKLNDTYHRVISMAGRIDSMKKLADSMKVLIPLEREVFGIGQDSEKGGTFEDFVDQLK